MVRLDPVFPVYLVDPEVLGDQLDLSHIFPY